MDVDADNSITMSIKCGEGTKDIFMVLAYHRILAMSDAARYKAIETGQICSNRVGDVHKNLLL